LFMWLFHYVIDFLELFPNSNFRHLDSLTVITLCRRSTMEKNSEQDEGLLVDVCNNHYYY